MLLLVVVIILIIFSPENYAQCAMCKMSPQSNLSNGGKAGSGLNGGILYMLAMPYLLVSSLGFIWYLNRKKENHNAEEQK